jgi:DNA polymerase V
MNRKKQSGMISVHADSSERSALLPMAGTAISAGFPSPADDYVEAGIDLNRELIRNQGSTFFGRVRGTSMSDAGINDGDVLVIDKSLEPYNGAVAVCFVDGEFTVKRIRIEKGVVFLVPENKEYKPIRITGENNFMVWGIVTYVIKKM